MWIAKNTEMIIQIKKEKLKISKTKKKTIYACTKYQHSVIAHKIGSSLPRGQIN